jgi:hypothetical protein
MLATASLSIGGFLVLAYVFWHSPGAQADPGRYERGLAAFHDALRAAKPEGFVGSEAYRVEGAPWLPQHAGYEDWYEIRDWAALGTLNAAAVSNPARPAHDEVAELAGGGAGGIYLLLHAGPQPATACLWLTKPRGIPYPEFLAALRQRCREECTLWQRQMALGPAPEFCVAGAAAVLRRLDPPASWQATIVQRRPVTA